MAQRRAWYEPQIAQEDVRRATQELREFMETEEWRTILEHLAARGERLRVHTFEDACDMFDAIYLTGAGFVDRHLRPMNDLAAVVEGFMMGYFYGASESCNPPRHPSELMPWIRMSVIGVRKTA